MAKHREGRTLGSGAGFPATRWSLVDLASGAAGSEALERFCQAYWYPLYAFARRSGKNPADAEDLMQGFFQKLLEKHWLADAEKGRLRTFLLTAFRRYMANEWRRQTAQARGGRWSCVEWERADGEQRYARSRDNVRPEDLFERQWALAVTKRTLDGLREEFEQRGKREHLDKLKAVLMLERGAKATGELTEDGASLCMETTKDERSVPFQRTDKAPPAIETDLVIIEDLALQMIVAIREKDDQKLKSLATDRIKDWREALPMFATELRERYRQLVGDEKFDLRATESMVQGEFGLVRCTGAEVLEGKCLILEFVKTPDRWQNCLLRNDSRITSPLSPLPRGERVG